MGKAAELFKNRIIGYGTKPADQFQANPQNYRKHPQRQRDAVSASLRSIGWIATVIENRQTGNLIDGHERVWQALPNNEDVPYLEVDLTPDEERLALAVFDPITNMAEIDPTIFDDLLHDINTDEPALQALLDELAQGIGLYDGKGEGDEPYSREIKSPVYKPSNSKPQVSELFDDARALELTQAIEAAEHLTDEERKFLIAAARRHTVFHFNKIADFYAHADKATQVLMEDSALIIIDFNRAIELGYVRLAEEIAKQYGADYGNA